MAATAFAVSIFAGMLVTFYGTRAIRRKHSMYSQYESIWIASGFSGTIVVSILIALCFGRHTYERQVILFAGFQGLMIFALTYVIMRIKNKITKNCVRKIRKTRSKKG